MIRARMTGPKGRRMILLGLEEMNVTRLRDGQPIHIHADELGFPGDIVIILGKDADALQRQLEPFIGPETAVHDERGRKRQ